MRPPVWPGARMPRRVGAGYVFCAVIPPSTGMIAPFR
jgi:hypothetical protein